MTTIEILFVAARGGMAVGALILAVIVLRRWFHGRLLRSPRLFLIGSALMVAAAYLSLWEAVVIGIRREDPPELLSWAWLVLFDGPLMLWFVMALYQADRRAEAEAELLRIASRDPLTDCLNRRGLAEGAKQLIAGARRRGSAVGLLAIDLDRFKALNDREGHAAGDALLCRVAETARATLRDSDLLGRTGGDEFVVLLADSDGRATREAAERLLAALTQVLEPSGVGASIGVAVLRRIESLDHAIKRADAALYRAKAEGRGRVAVAPEALQLLRRAA